MRSPITEFQLGYIRWLKKHVGCPIPHPELLSMMEASWLIQGLKERLYERRKYFLIREETNQRWFA